MANSLLTAQWVARKALIMQHAKANMTGRSNRDYQSLLPGPIQGVILGQVLSIRLPFMYTLRTGSKMSAQSSVQRYAQLSVSNQNGVDINFTSVERAMELNNFEEQILQPAMAKVSSGLETNVTSLTTQVPKAVFTYSTGVFQPVSFAQTLNSERYLTEALVPEDDKRTLTANPQASYEFVNSNSALFNPSSQISDQWLEGVISDRVAGMIAFRNTKLPLHTIGTISTGATPIVSATAGNSSFTSGVGNAWAATSTLSSTGWASNTTDTLNAGDIIQIASVYDVDPETKISLGRLKQFSVVNQATNASGTFTLTIAPALIYGGAYQNVSNAPTYGTSAVTVFGQTAGGYGTVSGLQVKTNLAWHRDAIVFANPAMLDLSELVKFTAAESFEGYNIRFAQQWDPDNDLLPGRLDTISGEVLAYPELAVQLLHSPVA